MTPMSVNECPAPMALTRCPRSAAPATIRASSAMLPGVTTVTSALAVAAQFVHVVMANTMLDRHGSR